MALDHNDTFDMIEASINVDAPFQAERSDLHLARREKRFKNIQYKKNLLETARIIRGAINGRVAIHRLQETMSRSDFPLLYGDILDRQALGYYNEWVPSWSNYSRRGTVRDFRTVKRFAMDGAEGSLSQVAELDEYKGSKLDETRYTYSVAKYGRVFQISWETIVNDDLDLLRDLPRRFARAARRTESRFAVGLYVSSSGPNSTFFSNTNKNIVNITNGATATNPPLSITGLQDAFTVLWGQKDADSEPIMIEAVWLVVPPSLAVQAQNILNATEIIVGADSAPQRLLTQNWMRNNVKIAVDPYLSIINTTNGTTSWYLMADVNVGRPALEVGFLRGYEAPQIFMKSSGQVRVGSTGLTDPMDGDWLNDTIAYKVRHVIGGTLLDPKMAVASNGTGV